MKDLPAVHTDPVREAEGECSWEICEAGQAQAWRACTIHKNAPWLDRSWAFKRPEYAAKAAIDLLNGKPQPHDLSNMATTGARCAYLP